MIIKYSGVDLVVTFNIIRGQSQGLFADPIDDYVELIRVQTVGYDDITDLITDEQTAEIEAIIEKALC